MIKQDIVHHVIERTGLPRTKAEAAVDTVFEGLKEALSAGERIELRGFGVFSVRARKTGIGRNPRTGTEVSITPGKAVRFKPGKELARAGNGRFRERQGASVARSPGCFHARAVASLGCERQITRSDVKSGPIGVPQGLNPTVLARSNAA